MKIFVYGTLKKGYHNNQLLSRTDSKFISEHILPGYKLFHAGFPVAMPSDGTSIKGEIWEIDPNGPALGYLDRLESNGYMYNRTQVDDLSLYVGHPRYWERELPECPNDNNVYYWDR